MTAVDQIFPLLNDLFESLGKISSLRDDWEGKVKVKSWLGVLTTMKASDELDKDQVRQIAFDLERCAVTAALRCVYVLFSLIALTAPSSQCIRRVPQISRIALDVIFAGEGVHVKHLFFHLELRISYMSASSFAEWWRTLVCRPRCVAAVARRAVVSTRPQRNGARATVATYR